MTAENVEFWIRVLGFLLSVGAMLFAYIRTRRQDVDDRLKALEGRADKQDAKIKEVDQTIKSLPEKDDIHNMEIAITKLVGKIDVMGTHVEGQREVMKRVELVVTRHEEHLLSGKG